MNSGDKKRFDNYVSQVKAFFAREFPDLKFPNTPDNPRDLPNYTLDIRVPTGSDTVVVRFVRPFLTDDNPDNYVETRLRQSHLASDIRESAGKNVILQVNHNGTEVIDLDD